MQIKFFIHSFRAFILGKRIKRLKTKLNRINPGNILTCRKLCSLSNRYQKTVRNFLTVSKQIILLPQFFRDEIQP